MTSKANFIPGLDLSESFYFEIVKPILRQDFPDLAFSAALIGSGSEVLGFDTEMSSDHHWGPRVMLFLRKQDEPDKESIATTFREKLPRRFRGYPTSYTAAIPGENGVQLLDYSDQGPVNHRVELTTMADFFESYLGLSVEAELTPADWLSLPEQKLRTITAGRVFEDGIQLEQLRKKFDYFPHDVWLYLLASGWTRIEQEEHLMGRAGFVGDEIGSSIIGSRLVRDLMRLCFFMERTYAPYPKWFGTAFSQLKAAPRLEPVLRRVLASTSWQERESNLTEAYQYVAQLHNALEITEPLPAVVSSFHDRPFLTISRGLFSQALVSKIADPAVKEIARRPLIGSIDQFSDSTDLLADPLRRQSLSRLYQMP